MWSVFSEISKIVENALSYTAEEFFKKILDPRIQMWTTSKI